MSLCSVLNRHCSNQVKAYSSGAAAAALVQRVVVVVLPEVCFAGTVEPSRPWSKQDCLTTMAWMSGKGWPSIRLPAAGSG